MKITSDGSTFTITGRFVEWRQLNMISRFIRKVKVNENGCWIWQTVSRIDGYGMLGTQGGQGVGMVLAHRYAYEIFVGPIPKSMLVCHKCDIRACVNPNHLFLGAAVDNSHDAKSKYRLRGPSKLTDEQVRDIRIKYATKKYSMATLAKEYQVVVAVIWNIVRFKHYEWVRPTKEEKNCLQARICRKVTPAAIETVRRRYLAGERPTDLAKAYGITATRIIQIGKHGY